MADPTKIADLRRRVRKLQVDLDELREEESESRLCDDGAVEIMDRASGDFDTVLQTLYRLEEWIKAMRSR